MCGSCVSVTCTLLKIYCHVRLARDMVLTFLAPTVTKLSFGLKLLKSTIELKGNALYK